MSKTNAKTVRVKKNLGQHPRRPSRSLWVSRAMSKVEFAQLLTKARMASLARYGDRIDLENRAIYLSGEMYCW